MGDISIHAPRAGRDCCSGSVAASLWIFQSTRPVRGATRRPPCRPPESRYFNPRAPCGARLWRRGRQGPTQQISIHAPRAGRDIYCFSTQSGFSSFQSTRPVRGATAQQEGLGDSGHDFNPRAPCGARPGVSPASGRYTSDFNPRAPCGARHRSFLPPWHQRRISIHAPRAGRDSKSIQNYFTHFCDKRQFLDNFTQNAAF